MQRKIIKKLISITIVLLTAALLVPGLSMNVFAWTGKSGVIKEPQYVIKIADDFSPCMKKSNRIKLQTLLGKGAELEEFVSGNPEVATVNSDGVVEAVGPGETTITAKAKLKGSGEIHKATCRIIVKGLIIESIEIKGADSTVKGTVYGEKGKRKVNGKLSEADIGDVMEIDSSNQVQVKDTITLQHSATININNSTLNINNGTLNVNQNSTLNVNQGGTLNVSQDGMLNINCATLNVNKRSTLNVNGDGALNVNKDGTLNVNRDGNLNVNQDGTINVNRGGTLNVNQDGIFTVKTGASLWRTIPAQTYRDTYWEGFWIF